MWWPSEVEIAKNQVFSELPVSSWLPCWTVHSQFLTQLVETIACMMMLWPSWGLSWRLQTVKNLSAMWETRVRKVPWRREWQPTSVFLPGKFHGQRSLEGYSPWDRKELDTTELLPLLFTGMAMVCVTSKSYSEENCFPLTSSFLLPLCWNHNVLEDRGQAHHRSRWRSIVTERVPGP